MLSFSSVILWIHVSAVILWIGGLFTIPFVAAPAVRRMLPADDAAQVGERLVRRFLRFSRELIPIIFLTGLFNVLSIGYETQYAYSSRFLWLVGAKFVLFVLMTLNQLWYGLRLVPRGLMSLGRASAVANVVLAAIVLYLAVLLRGG